MSKKGFIREKKNVFPPKLLNIKIKIEKELETIKLKLKDNLLYEIKDIKIVKIQPTSPKRILEFSEITKITNKKDADDKQATEFNNLSSYIKKSLRSPLERRKKRSFENLREDERVKKSYQKAKKEYGETIIEKKMEERIRKRIDRWKEEHKDLKRTVSQNEEEWETQINQQIKDVDENLKKVYEIADFKVSLKWIVRSKKDAYIELDTEEKNRKKGFFRKYIIIDSISLYNKEHGLIFDTFTPNIPMEVNITEEQVKESEKSNPEYSYEIKYTFEMTGLGWSWVWPWGPKTILFERINYRIIIKYISDDKYADSTTPKTFEMVLTFPCTWYKPYWPHITAFPICCIGSEGGFWQSPNWNFDVWGKSYKVKFTSKPDEDYYKGLVVDYFDGVRNRNILSVSWGISNYFGQSIGISAWWSEKAVCSQENSTGQNIRINITPFKNIWGEYLGVFHAGGWLRVILDSVASEENRTTEVGNIKFNIPLELWYIQPWVFGVTRGFVRSFYGSISDRKGSKLLNYVRYSGIPSPKYSITPSSTIISGETTQICLKIANLSTQVKIEDLNIEIGNVDPYLRPIDGDYTKPNTSEEKIIAPQNQRQFCWILQGDLTDKDSILVTPKFDITYKYGNPVPSHRLGNQDTIDGPIITINRV